MGPRPRLREVLAATGKSQSQGNRSFMRRGYRRGVPMLAALLTAAFLPGFALTATGPDGGRC